MTLKNRLSWIKASNETQIKWAHQYLRNNGAHIDIGSVDRYECVFRPTVTGCFGRS